MRLPGALSSLILLMLLGSTSVHGAGFLQACLNNSDCGLGLYCSSCLAAGAIIPRCTRYQTTPLTNITSLPYNEVSWLTTHNSYAIVGVPQLTGPRITFENQEDGITSQLNNGVRGFMLDTYDFLGDVWLCHSFGGNCYNYTSFEPLLNTLNEIYHFMSSNPSEIVTIILEDYVKAPNGITNVFKAANLTQYLFPLASMPANGAAWPTIGTLITNEWRLLLFTSIQSKQASEGIAYQWNFMNENQYGDGGMVPGACPNRAESRPMNFTGVSLILQNFFRTDPIELESCNDNSDDLYSQLPVCYADSGKRWANFLAVDFYKQSTGGGSFESLDKLNGQIECGCNSPLSCQNSTKLPGECPNDPTLAEFSATFVPANASTSTSSVNGRLTSTSPDTSSTPSPDTSVASSPAPSNSAHNTLPGTSSVLLVALCLIFWTFSVSV